MLWGADKGKKLMLGDSRVAKAVRDQHLDLSIGGQAAGPLSVASDALSAGHAMLA